MDTNNNENLEKEVVNEVTNPEMNNVEATPVAVAVEEPLKVSSEVSAAPKKKSKVLPIILCIIGVICLGIGVFLTLTSEEESSDKNNGTVEENKDKDKTNTNFVDSIKDFSDYTKYDMNATIKMTSDAMNIDMVENGRYDTVNNVYYTSSSLFGMYDYKYYDVNNHIVYSSDTNVEWEKYTDNEISLPVFPGTVIGKVKTNEGVTDLGNGKYSLSMDTLELPDMDGYSGKVPTTVTFDSNGYLTEIVLDMTSLMTEEGVTSYIYTVTFANINTGDDVTIPNDVIANAVESEW